MVKSRRLSLTLLAAALVFVNLAHGQDDSLTIGPGDILHVHVFDTPDLDQDARVSDNGNLPLILGGEVQVAGLTTVQAARAIEGALQKGNILLHPKVAVTITDSATQKVTVSGAVKVPGVYVITTPRSVLDVLAMAGGLTDLADRNILVERRNQKDRVHYIVSNDAATALDTAVKVYPGDSVVVPLAGIVYVLGDVAHPGGYTMASNDVQVTALQLIARAGGTNHSAVPSHSRLIRKIDKAYVEESLPLSDMQKGKRADIALQPDDIIYVPFSYFRNGALEATSMLSAAAAASIYKF